MSRESRAGVILAGGEGRRMGGAHKPTLLHQGRPLVAYALDAVAPLCDEVLVTCGASVRADLAAIVEGRGRLVTDGGAGPAGALRAAAEATTREWLVVAPADSPNLTRELYDELLAAVGQREGAVAMADGVVNPLVAVYKRAPLLATFWSGTIRAPRDALARMDVVAVPVAAWDVRDVDTPEDLSSDRS